MVTRYLQRLGVTDRAFLPELQAAHLLSVPFENLSIHLGEPIELDEALLADKVVGRNRGGFCYELNGAFAGLLRALGYRVTLLSARAAGSDGLGPPFDHLVLRVDEGESWLVDVGFGDHAVHPLALERIGPQGDPAGQFEVTRKADGDVDVFRDGVLQYRIELRPRELADFEPTCWWQRTSPKSHFTQSLVCSIALPAGRVTLSDHRLITTVDGQREERVLVTDGEVLDAYRRLFGIALTTVPRVSGGG